METEPPERKNLRTRLEEKLTALLIEVIEITEMRFQVAV